MLDCLDIQNLVRSLGLTILSEQMVYMQADYVVVLESYRCRQTYPYLVSWLNTFCDVESGVQTPEKI